MTWWLIFFVAVSITIIAKWYFSNAIASLRTNLSRLQRETLELKGTLTDAREAHKHLLRLGKSKELEIVQLKKQNHEHKITIRLRMENKGREKAED